MGSAFQCVIVAFVLSLCSFARFVLRSIMGEDSSPYKNLCIVPYIISIIGETRRLMRFFILDVFR